VGDGEPPAATFSKALVSPDRNPEIAFLVALLSNSVTTAEALMVGFPDRTSAAPPETCGHAMDVPLNVAVPVSDVCDADKILLPGAQMSVQLP